MRKLLVLCLILLTVYQCKSINPPVWPEHFSQSFDVYTGYSLMTGRMWYDFSIKFMRMDLDHPDQRMFCNYYYQYDTPCTVMANTERTYHFLPEEQLCCYEQNYPYNEFPTRDWLATNYTFTGEKVVNGQSFYRWQHYNWTRIEYLADKSEQLIPRRNALDKVIYDYWVDSYNEEPINPNVFRIPSYCKQKCSYNGEGKLETEERRNSFLRSNKPLINTRKVTPLEKQ